MHPSFERLLECAREATARMPAGRRVVHAGDLKEALKVSSATLTNWKSERGVSRDGALAAERKFGCSAQWILEGGVRGQRPAAAGVGIRTVAQEVSQAGWQHAPKYIAWEALMTTPLDSEFQTDVPDASMAPELPAGARILLITGVEPEPGDFVLVTDRVGNHYLREYRQLRPGSWQAHAINPAYLPLDSAKDGLTVIAVFDGVRGRRSKR